MKIDTDTNVFDTKIIVTLIFQIDWNSIYIKIFLIK